MTRVLTGKLAARRAGDQGRNAASRLPTEDRLPAQGGLTSKGRRPAEAPLPSEVEVLPGTGRRQVEARRDGELDALLEGFELGQIVSHLLRRAHFRAEEIFAEQAGERLGLTPRQKALLISCYRYPGSNQSAIAERIVLDRNTVAEMVSRMVRTGLLVRSRDPEDARSNRVHITTKGIRMLKAIMPIDPLIEARVVEPLPPEYRPLFLKCLRLMAGLEPGAAGSGVDSRGGQR